MNLSTQTRVPTKGGLSTWQIAVLISAAAAPLSGVVATGPIALIFGNGAGLPGIFLIVAALMIVFGLGYTALIREIPGEGAFYRYLSVVFGSGVGNGAACVAMLAYLSLTTAVGIGTAYFADFTLSQFGLHFGFVPWAVILIGVVALLGRANVDIAAKVVVPMIVIEFSLLLALIVAIVFHKGVETFPTAALAPHYVFGAGAGVSLMIVVACFIGVESAALYASEASNPDRSIPRATIAAILIISLIYFPTFWAIVGDLGVGKIGAIAAAGQTSSDMQQGLILRLFGTNISLTVQGIVAVLLCTSNFASFIALHNAAARYVHTLSLHRIIPSALSVQKNTDSPARASLATTAAETFAVVLVVLAHFDYVVAFAPLYALGVTGVIALQAVVAAAVVTFFVRRGDKRTFVTVIAPSVAFLGFVVTGFLIAQNYGILAGSESIYVRLSPLAFVAVFTIGFMRRRRVGISATPI